MLLLATNKLIHRFAMNCATQVWNTKLIEYTVGCIEKADKLQTIIQGLYLEILNSRSDLGVILMGLLNSEIELRFYFQASQILNQNLGVIFGAPKFQIRI